MESYAHHQREDLSDLFVGRSIVRVELETGTLTLSDGTVLVLTANDGCSGCASGYYELTSLNTCDNIITRVKVVKRDAPKVARCEEGYVYSLFVFAEDKRINVARIEGDDGNGYYGTGFTIHVKGQA